MILRHANLRPVVMLPAWNDTSVIVEVHLAPPPDILPNTLSGKLKPVRQGAKIVDWKLDTSAAGPKGRPIVATDAVDAYTEWRRHWRPTYNLGPRSLVESFVEFMTSSENGLGAHLPTLESLDLTGDTISDGRALRLSQEISAARELLTSSHQRGWALRDVSEAGRTRTVRTAAAFERPVVLHHVGDASVSVHRDEGFVLTTNDQQVRLSEWSLRRPDGLPLVSGLWVRTEGGAEDVVTGDAARALQQLSPDSAHVRVRQVSLLSVWADTVVGLSEAATAAVDTRAVIGSRWA